MYPQPHLLSIPQETRDIVYAEIRRRIQDETYPLEKNPASHYDGLRLCCQQLYQETSTSVFSFAYSTHRIHQVLELKLHRQTFERLRSLSLEISFQLPPNMYRGLATFIDHMQFGLQELRLFFVGKDGQGNQTAILGCGNKVEIFPTGDAPFFLVDGQDFEHQWTLVRHVAGLRNLRVLHIENANIPLHPGLLCSNKPHLQALSVLSDPRSVSDSFDRMQSAQVLHLHRGICTSFDRLPTIHTLSLSANSVPHAEILVRGVCQRLRHFSWRVPSPEYHVDSGARSFYSMTNRLVHSLSCRAPDLETLRLCLSVGDSQGHSETRRREFHFLAREMKSKLPIYHALRHLEIHVGGQGSWRFFQTDLIYSLPVGLSRLYISDRMIPVSELVAQVRNRYFSDSKRVHRAAEATESLSAHSSDPASNQPQERSSATPTAQSEGPDEHGFSGDLLSYGELKGRTDMISFCPGRLGFINLEYGRVDASDDRPVSASYHQSNRTEILRLNGQLLDREHNLHLADAQWSISKHGVPQRRDRSERSQAAGIQQEATTSRNRDSTTPAGTHEHDGWDWYFGNENEAEDAFRREPVAKAEGQRQKPDMVDIEVRESSRCRWACADFTLPAVSSFVVPSVPADWRRHISQARIVPRITFRDGSRSHCLEN